MQTHHFQAEVQQLLKLVIHSLYSNREIFLRELISNASDASDKLRFLSVTQPELIEDDSPFKIKVIAREDAKELIIEDNGIGMDHDEVIANIGTIAKSGTKEFLSKLSGDQAKDSNLIGQFGVGFYAAFMVADKVVLETRKAGTSSDKGIRWESEGTGEFKIDAIDKPTRGTRVTLHLKEDAQEYLSSYRIEHLIQKYSDHITLPIELTIEDKAKDKTEGKEATEPRIINQATALWARAKNDISEEQYQGFYKHLTNDTQNPLAYTHARVEGKQDYTLLFYIPAQAPFDLYEPNRKHGVRLYVRRVMIFDNTEKLLPNYLRFIRGVIDAADLPLNVSREILQDSRDLEAIRAGATKKILGMLEDVAKNQPENYEKFWQQFGKVLKEGIAEDPANQERIAKLCRFYSTQESSATPNVSLDDYIGRKAIEQNEIYYLLADHLSNAQNSPYLEIFKKKNIEVLLLTDRVDEWWIGHLRQFQERTLHSVMDADLKVTDDDKPKIRTLEEAKLQNLIQKIEAQLKDKIKAVKVSQRLTESPACLVFEHAALGKHLAEMLKAAGHAVPLNPPTLEINPDHALIERIAQFNERETEAENTQEWIELLYEQALLNEAGTLDDPAGFVKRLNRLLLESTDDRRIITL